VDKEENMIKLGQKVRDIVTGFEGIATAKVEYLNGCIQFCVKPKVTDGKMLDSEYIDIQQLEIIDDGLLNASGLFQKVKDTFTGGDMSDTPSDRYNG